MDPCWDELERRKTGFLTRSLAVSSTSTYNVGVRQYLAFCQQVRVPSIPLSEDVLENFCVSLSSRISQKSIKVYLSGVQHWSKLQGCRVLIKDMHRLKYVLSGIRRAQGNSFTRPIRPPVTVPMLEQICAFVARTESPFDCDMLTSAVLLAFFGLLRVSEYTCPSPSLYDPEIHLSIQDVSVCWERGVALVNIKMSKTDPFREGVTVRVSVLGHHLCPVHALVKYLLRRGASVGPLFVFQNGAFLTRDRIVDILSRALPSVIDINTHSFRRGGASALAAAGTPDHIIQVLGRWKSNAFTRYIQLTDEFIVNAHRSMTNPPPRKPSSKP